MKIRLSWRKLLLFAFGMSIFSSLVYEVVWTRYLSLVFGTTVYAFSAVLTSFMAGLAIGSYYYGKKADTSENTPRLFAKLQFILAAYSVLLILLFKILPYPYLFLFSFFESHLLTTISIFAMVFAVLVIPTIIIGAAFPLISRIYAKDIGKDISEVYAADTIFGAAGAFFAGFLFLQHLGLAGTILLAAAINLISGLIFRARGRMKDE